MDPQQENVTPNQEDTSQQLQPQTGSGAANINPTDNETSGVVNINVASNNLPNDPSEPSVITPQNSTTIAQPNMPNAETSEEASDNLVSNINSNQLAQDQGTVQELKTSQPEKPVIVNSFAPPPIQKPKKSKKPLFVALLVFIAIIIIGSLSAYAYVGIYVPNKPNNVIKQAAVNAFNPNVLTGIGIKATINNKDNPSDPSIISIVAGKKDNLIRADFDADISAFKVTGSLLVNDSDDTIYLKINELPTLINLWGINDQKVANKVGTKWIKVNPSDLNELGATQEGDALSNDKCLSAATKIITSENFKNEILKIYKNNEFAKATKISKEQVNGKNATKYKVDINESVSSNFLNQLETSLSNNLKAAESSCVLDDESSNDAADSEGLLSDTKYKDLYVWVGPKKQIEKIEISFTDDEGGGKLEILLNQSNKLEFTVPKDVTTLEAILKEIEQSYKPNLSQTESFDFSQSFDFGAEPFN